MCLDYRSYTSTQRTLQTGSDGMEAFLCLHGPGVLRTPWGEGVSEICRKHSSEKAEPLLHSLFTEQAEPPNPPACL